MYTQRMENELPLGAENEQHRAAIHTINVDRQKISRKK